MRGGAIARALVVALAVLALTGCWYHRVEMTSPVMPATEYQGATYWSFFWGAMQREVQPDNCNGQPLAEVKVSSNLGYALLTAATLGLAAPVRVEWRCAKAQPVPGTIPTGGGR